MTGLKIQIVSDLHFELTPDNAPQIPVTAPHIALLGDIGRGNSKKYGEFVKDLSTKYTTVLLVSGNHEYYNDDYSAVNETLAKLADVYPNVSFLNRTGVEIDGIKVIGCTLWSRVPPACQRVVQATLNDYRLIFTEDVFGNQRPLTVDDTNELHAINRRFLEDKIEKSRNDRQSTLVLTHHAPSMVGTSSPQFEGLPTNHGFATDMKDLMGPPVVAWAYGHTHFNAPSSRGLDVGGTMLISNQKGYSREKVGRPFDPGAHLYVESTRATWIPSIK
jgi:predicted phosphohydrolase